MRKTIPLWKFAKARPSDILYVELWSIIAFQYQLVPVKKQAITRLKKRNFTKYESYSINVLIEMQFIHLYE